MAFAVFGVGEIDEPNVRDVFYPKLYRWIFTILGLAGYLVSVLFILFGTIILAFQGLRNIYLNWTIASYISAILLIILSRYLITKLGARFLQINSTSYSMKTILGKTKLIDKESIVNISINYPHKEEQLIPISSPLVIISTHDKMIQFRTNLYSHELELVSYFEVMADKIDDDFAEYYHKSRTTLTSLAIRMSQDSWGLIGLTIISVYLFMALWGTLALIIEPLNNLDSHTLFFRNPEFQNGSLEGYTYETAIFHPPSSEFWFGTDFIGRDVFARLIFGTVFTFMVAAAGSAIAILVITTLGFTSGYYGGTFDPIIMRISDALLTFPPFIPLILISVIAEPIRIGIQGGYFLAIFIGMSIFTWPLGTRLLRSEILELVNSDYVQAARQIGSTDRQILTKHIIPKTLPTVMLIFAYAFTDIILGMTLLGFIGMDSESTLTWGSDLAKAVKYGQSLETTWWTVLFPTIWIFILVFGLTIMADSIRDNMDPMIRGGLNAVPYSQRKQLEGLL